MSQIIIPFKEEFREKMLSGQKWYTTRTKCYGEEGDTFEAFGATFEVRWVIKSPLLIVAQDCFLSEGFDTPEEFIAYWKKLHPRRGYVPEQKVFVHFFRRVEASLPAPKDLRGMSPDFTGDMESGEYVRSLRE